MIDAFKDGYQHIFEDNLIKEIIEVGIFKDISEGSKLIEIGEYIKGMPLLISGAIKVLREDTDGNELLLYYLEKGDTCSITMTCCVSDSKSEVRAIAETDTKVIMIPIQKMEEWMGKYKTWRYFVLESYDNRINELLTTLDSIAFNKMDIRLMNYLVEKSRINNNEIIYNTHQEIAYDLHCSRVAVSRLLKKLEQMGKIELHRNYIKLLAL